MWHFDTSSEHFANPAHLLLGPDDGILSVLDWTTAAVSDPALDFLFQQVSALLTGESGA